MTEINAMQSNFFLINCKGACNGVILHVHRCSFILRGLVGVMILEIEAHFSRLFLLASEIEPLRKNFDLKQMYLKQVK